MRTHVLSVHRTRRKARKVERLLTDALNAREACGAWTPGVVAIGFDWPVWARGVRVEKAGLFQYAVVATEARGH